ncbi:MAG: corrinoid protein [Firmicutes bacterium]|jgi:corrinoid protein of di/trimethylamine methyltransferase|nr:corrinoid protein [Bacillota bacterium]
MSSLLLEKLVESVVRADREEAERLAREALAAGVAPRDILMLGLSPAMTRLGRLWEEGEVFLPEVLASAEVFEAVSRSVDSTGRGGRAPVGRCVLGTVRGDLHDLGKNIVGIMLRTAGFEVVDLGKDVPCEAFVGAVRQWRADVLGMSALLTTTMREQRNVIELLKKEGLREGVLVMVGGAPVTAKWAEEIGADAYAANAHEAVEKAERMLGVV